MRLRKSWIATAGAALLASVSLWAEGSGEGWLKGREDAKHVETPFGEVHLYHKGETDHSKLLETLQVRVNPGKSPHPPHQHPEEEMMLVIEGEAEFEVDGKKTRASAGSILYAYPGSSHSFKNVGSGPLVVHVFKWGPK